MTKTKIEIVEAIPEKHYRGKNFNPYDKNVVSGDIQTSIIVEDWECRIVEPKDSALHTSATIDPFGKGIDWEQREQEMLELMESLIGIGLASPQLGSNYNMFVMEHSHLGNIGVYKPEILKYSDETHLNEEGCLSFPLIYLHVERSKEIQVRYFKSDGKTQVEVMMDHRDAIVFQHEYDHLQGELFIDKVSEFKLKRAFEKREKLFKKLGKKFGHE